MNLVALLGSLLVGSVVLNVWLYGLRRYAVRRGVVLYAVAVQGEVTGTDFPGGGWAGILRDMESDGFLDSRSMPGGPERAGHPKFYYRLSTRILGRPQ